MADDSASDRPRCSFCQYACPRPIEPVVVDRDGERHVFCSEGCREAHERTESVYIGDDSHRKLAPGVAALDASLPQGLPRNSFVLLVGNAGTREEAIQAELVWRALERGEPAVIVAFTEPPTSVVENFLRMEWNVLPYLEADRLRVVDCFTYRMDDRDRLFDRMTEWNAHLRRAVEPQTTAVRDPSDSQAVQNALDNCLEALGMVETGLVVVDSLAEYGSLVQPVQAYDFVKNVRAEVCKGRFVPIVAGAVVAGEADDFPRDLDYVVDGVVDLALDGSVLEDTLFRRLRVRKLRGVLSISEWHTYEYTSGLGMVTFDPHEEMASKGDDGPARGDEAVGDVEPEDVDSDEGVTGATGSADGSRGDQRAAGEAASSSAPDEDSRSTVGDDSRRREDA